MALYRTVKYGFPVARNPQVKWKTGMLNEAEEMKDADFPKIRLFHVEHQMAPDGEKRIVQGSGWFVVRRI